MGMDDGEDIKKTPRVNMKGNIQMIKSTVGELLHGHLAIFSKVTISLTNEKAKEK